MAYASWLNIAISNGRAGAVYRAWSAIGLLAGDMVGTWTRAGCSAGTEGAAWADTGWVNDGSPADGAWVVLQSEVAWASTHKLQVFIGYRATSGALAGFGTKAAGIWVCCSTSGGWNNAAGYFGAALADYRNTAIQGLTTASGSARTLGLVLTSGDADTNRPGSVTLMERNGAGAQDIAFHAGAACQPTGMASVYEAAAGQVIGQADATGGAGTWGGPSAGKVPDVGLSTIDVAITEMPALLTVHRDAAGVYAERDIVWKDTTAGAHFGVVDQVRATGAPNATVSLDGTRWAYGNLSYPREATRDGSWV